MSMSLINSHLTTPRNVYIDSIKRSYKSLDHPDFSFVKKSIRRRPYEPLISRLREYAPIEPILESDDDVCFSYLVKGRASLWKLDLSMIGPYGMFVRLKSCIDTSDFLIPGRPDLVDFESKVINILAGANIKLLGTDELEKPVKLNLFNTQREKTCLYQALFCDQEALPWKK